MEPMGLFRLEQIIAKDCSIYSRWEGRYPGLTEVPMGTTLRRVVYDIAGDMRNGRPFKAVQIGGPSGGCIPESLLDLPIDFDSLREAGSMMGSGGMIVHRRG